MTCFKFNSDFVDSFHGFIKDHVFGQDLGALRIVPLVRDHIEYTNTAHSLSNPHRALALSLHGSSGTGKSYVSDFLANALFASKRHSVGKKIISKTYKFEGPRYSDERKVAQYRQEISDKILETLKICPRSLFIFVDSHLFPEGVLDGIAPFLKPGTVDVNGVDYTQAIYIFQSNVCFKAINVETNRVLVTKGTPRSEMDYAAMHKVLDKCLQKQADGTTGEMALLRQKLVISIPFLPLEREHVVKCIAVQLFELGEKWRRANKITQLFWAKSVKDWLLGNIKFKDIFSQEGCKKIKEEVVTGVGGSLERPLHAPCKKAGFLGEAWKSIQRCYPYSNDMLVLTMVQVKKKAKLCAVAVHHNSKDPAENLAASNTSNSRRARLIASTSSDRLFFNLFGLHPELLQSMVEKL
eukprot:CAMPEP_0175121144 /NCGR_PEP_ID=MMETSP0087-20121206/1007_1 /TAXON_ID=136419 /ORGANISM="Unknown Unknown, Strain D1" /LENGTH=409 /DNA_ID=CAMNT_0016402657 /DNA_START=45 /DNA_END=1271 /DNA_ORIENTATION=-